MDSQQQTDLKQQRFQMLEDIARDLTGDICFPSCLDVVLIVLDTVRKPGISIDELLVVVRIDPLLSAQILREANSPACNPGGKFILNLKQAISLLGLETAKHLIANLATKQLLFLKELVPFSALSRQFWEHSVSSAAAAFVIAKYLTRIPPEEAMLAAMLHDIGAFYMLFKTNQYPELRARPESLQYVIVQWHESIGDSLIYALGLPESIAEALRDHDQPRSPPVLKPGTLGDVVYVANLLGDTNYEWLHKELPPPSKLQAEFTHPVYLALHEEIQTKRQELMRPVSK